MMLKPQDIFIQLKLVAIGKADWSYPSLASDLFMSSSEVHASIKRATESRLFDTNRKKPIRKALEEFLVHGIKYAYPPKMGGLTRGIPTSYAGPPLNHIIVQPMEEPPVWPYLEGNVLGFEFPPLFKSVPKAAEKDKKLYELLVLVDAIRGGRAREREIAARELKSKLGKI